MLSLLRLVDDGGVAHQLLMPDKASSSPLALSAQLRIEPATNFWAEGLGTAPCRRDMEAGCACLTSNAEHRFCSAVRSSRGSRFGSVEDPELAKANAGRPILNSKPMRVLSTW